MKGVFALSFFVFVSCNVFGQDFIANSLCRNLWNKECIEEINDKSTYVFDSLACDALVRFFDYKRKCIDVHGNLSNEFPHGEFVDMTICDNLGYVKKHLDTLDLHFINYRQHNQSTFKDTLRVTYLWKIFLIDANVEFFFMPLSLRSPTINEQRFENYVDMVYCFYGAFKVVYCYDSETEQWGYKHIVRCY